MKHVTSLSAIALAAFLVAGCQSSDQSTSGDKQSKAPASQTDKKDTGSTSSDQSGTSSDAGSSEKSAADTKKMNEVVQKAMKAITTPLVKRAPQNFSIDASQSLTASTSAKQDQYKVVFYATDTPEPVNSDKVKAMSEDEGLAVLSAESFPNTDKAHEAIKQQAKVTDGNVDLGHNIKAKANSGKKQTDFLWDEGKWSMQVTVPVPLSNFGEQIAKQMVAYLDTHTLPEPQSSGHVAVTFGKNQANTVIMLQEDKTVYTLKTAKDPVDALKMAVSLKTYK